jgi:hypothetical protein
MHSAHHHNKGINLFLEGNQEEKEESFVVAVVAVDYRWF